jgi:hypothetical protein
MIRQINEFSNNDAVKKVRKDMK